MCYLQPMRATEQDLDARITVTGILANTMLSPVIPDVLSDLGVADDRAGL